MLQRFLDPAKWDRRFRLLGWAAGPPNSTKQPGNAGDLVAGDLRGFPELRGGFSTRSTPRLRQFPEEPR